MWGTRVGGRLKTRLSASTGPPSDTGKSRWDGMEWVGVGGGWMDGKVGWMDGTVHTHKYTHIHKPTNTDQMEREQRHQTVQVQGQL